MEWRRCGIGRQFPGVGGEFRMLFPAQDRGTERRPKVLFARQGRRQAACLAERYQIGTVGQRPGAGGIEGEMDDARRYRNRRERPAWTSPRIAARSGCDLSCAASPLPISTSALIAPSRFHPCGRVRCRPATTSTLPLRTEAERLLALHFPIESRPRNVENLAHRLIRPVFSGMRRVAWQLRHRFAFRRRVVLVSHV
jgi:hypothetical protein